MEIVFTAVQACPVHTGPDCTVASTALSRQRDCAACSCSADCTAGQCRTTTTQQAAQASFLSHFCSCFTSVVPHTTPGWGTSRCCDMLHVPAPRAGHLESRFESWLDLWLVTWPAYITNVRPCCRLRNLLSLSQSPLCKASLFRSSGNRGAGMTGAAAGFSFFPDSATFNDVG